MKSEAINSTSKNQSKMLWKFLKKYLNLPDEYQQEIINGITIAK